MTAAGSPAATTIEDITAWDAARWDELAVASPKGHVFQSWAWASIKAPLGWRARRYAVAREGRVVAVASVLERVLPWPVRWLRLLYVPRGPVLLEPTPTAASAALAALRRIARTRRATALTIDPLWEADGEVADRLARAGFRPTPHDVQISRTAMIVPLMGDEAEQHRRLSKSAANNLNRALRNGIAVHRIEATPPEHLRQGLVDFYGLYEATARRAGFIVRDRSYLLSQWEALSQGGHASLWFATLDGRPHAGAIIYRCGQTVVTAHAGGPEDEAMRESQANFLLHWTITRWAADAGFTGYDLGGVDTHATAGQLPGPGDPLRGLYVFKRGLGAEPVVYVRAHDYAPIPVLGAAWRTARALSP